MKNNTLTIAVDSSINAQLSAHPKYQRYIISFSQPPGKDARTLLKQNGYQFSGKNKVWEKNPVQFSDDINSRVQWLAQNHDNEIDFFNKMATEERKYQELEKPSSEVVTRERGINNNNSKDNLAAGSGL